MPSLIQLSMQPIILNADHNLHLFSNVLDIISIQKSISSWAGFINKITGKHFFISVGVQYSSSYKGFSMLKNALKNAEVKIAIQDFAIQSEVYSVISNHWKYQPSKGVMMVLYLKI